MSHSYKIGLGNFIGVIPPISFKDLSYPKQLLLMFDKLAVDLANNLSAYENKIVAKARPEIDWLASEGLLTTLSGIIAENKSEIDKSNVTVSGSIFLPSTISNELERFAKSPLRAYNGLKDLRTIASRLRELENLDAVAVGLPDTPIEIDKNADRDAVIRITLNQFPIPSNSTSWENIIDFKKDKKTIEQFSRLKVWMNKISTKERKGFEVADELRDIINSYENEMKASKMNCNQGILEVIITTPFEIADNLIRLKFSDAVKSLFKIKKQNMQLLKEEKKAKGREIAYIISAREKFKNKHS